MKQSIELSPGLKRQDEFINNLKNENFDYGLVYTRAFLKGIRDIGYKSTATALFENIDNSIQAEATNVHLIFEHAKGDTGGIPSKIAILDDGHGMSAEMLRIAVLWGGSDRIDNREGFGKYGYGLPSSCVSIGQRFSVFSKRIDSNWNKVTIDIDDIAKNDPAYRDAATGRIIAPLAVTEQLPKFVSNYISNFEKNNDFVFPKEHGTAVIIEKIDRVTYERFGKLKDFLLQQCGITYRNFLRKVNIYIDNLKTLAIDPLFLTEGHLYYDLDEDRAKALPSLKIMVTDKVKKIDLGEVKVRFSVMPPTFLRKPEAKNKLSASKSDNNARFPIRKENNGIIILRAGRQIDIINSKCPWTTFQNNDRYIGIEIDFPPALDEEFSITTAKQQIVISDRLWNILENNGVRASIRQQRKDWDDQHDKWEQAILAKLETGQENAENGKGEPKTSEKVMAEASKEFGEDPELAPKEVKEEGQKNLESEVKNKSEQSGVDPKLVRKSLESEIKENPFKVEFFEEDESPFYKVKQVGGQIRVEINRRHPFYTAIYNRDGGNPEIQNALEILLFVLAESELRVHPERRTWYQTERGIWSMKLRVTLEKYAQYFAKNPDNKLFKEELAAAQED